MKLKEWYVEDMSNAEVTMMERRLRPFLYDKITERFPQEFNSLIHSMDGFISSGESLRKVVEKDNATLDKRGITHKQIGDKIECLIEQYLRQMDLQRHGRAGASPDDRSYEGRFRIEGLFYLGGQTCPFFKQESLEGAELCGVGSSSDYAIENIKTGKKLGPISHLIPHLIRQHHFFDGNVNYRVDPETAIDVLELKPRASYAPKWETEYVWEWKDGDDKLRGAKKYEEDPEEKHKLTGQKVFVAVRNRFNKYEMLHQRGKATLYVRSNGALLVAPGTDSDRELEISPIEIRGAVLSGRMFTPYTRFRREKRRFVSPL